jgi:hypothetical protein
MHPEDTLDTTQAEMLFSLSAITTGEMVRDMKQRQAETAQQVRPNALAAIAGQKAG